MNFYTFIKHAITFFSFSFGLLPLMALWALLFLYASSDLCLHAGVSVETS